MPSEAGHPTTQEIELKLALPGADPAGLALALAKSPLLARRKPTRQQLHNVYFDTPDQVLRQARAALRLRQLVVNGRQQWLQTLKLGGNAHSALTQRGEWEAPVPGPALDPAALGDAPWAALDADGRLWDQLRPQFTTRFERTRWLVRGADRSQVEVALDLGQIEAGERHWPICELELELKAGSAEALFAVARQLAQMVAVVPAAVSKAERGYALAQHAQPLPRHAGPPPLAADLARGQAARLALREMFMQFCDNLAALRHGEDVELVHQARVGWRRFRSAFKLFGPALDGSAVPSWQALHPLLVFLGDLRDLDVARMETLPQFAHAYANGDAVRAQRWQAMAQALEQAAELKRKSVRYALQEPAVGACLLALSEWLELSPEPPSQAPKHGLRHWVRRRVARQHSRLQAALKTTASGGSEAQRHRARILAKRLRYCVEAVQPLLPKKDARVLLKQASAIQTTIGQQRDLAQACALLAELELEPGLAEFLRGVAVGRAAIA
jgi:inorganic triphosphatase YgiF